MSNILLSIAAIPVRLAANGEPPSAREVAAKWRESMNIDQDLSDDEDRARLMEERRATVLRISRSLFVCSIVGLGAALIPTIIGAALPGRMMDQIAFGFVLAAFTLGGAGFVVSIKESVIKSQNQRFMKMSDDRKKSYRPSRWAHPCDLDFILGLPVVYVFGSIIWYGMHA